MLGRVTTDLVGDILARIDGTTVSKCIVSSKEMVKMMTSREYSLLFHGKQEDKPSKVLFMGKRDKEFKVWTREGTAELAPIVNGFRVASLTSNDKGILCFKDPYHNVWIYNPTSGELRKLPRLATNFDIFVLMTMTRKFFLGSVSGVFKALAVTKAGNETTCHVFTLGGDISWRRLAYIEEKVVLESTENSICIDGLLYIAALRENQRVLVRFDLKKETFTVVEVVTKMKRALDHWLGSVLLNVQGNIAIGQTSDREGNLVTLWMFHASSSSWCERRICTLPLREGIEEPVSIHFEGGTQRGDLLIFYLRELRIMGIPKIYVVYLDLVTNTFQRFLMEKIPRLSDSQVIWNHIDQCQSFGCQKLIILLLRRRDYDCREKKRLIERRNREKESE